MCSLLARVSFWKNAATKTEPKTREYMNLKIGVHGVLEIQFGQERNGKGMFEISLEPNLRRETQVIHVYSA